MRSNAPSRNVGKVTACLNSWRFRLPHAWAREERSVVSYGIGCIMVGTTSLPEGPSEASDSLRRRSLRRLGQAGAVPPFRLGPRGRSPIKTLERQALMAHEQLASALIPLSRGSTLSEVRGEWELAEIFHQNQPQECLCGHYPILEVCVLRNRITDSRAEVGNVCVKKFLGLPSDRIFSALRRVLRDIERALSSEVIEHAYRLHWINDWERDFYIDTWRKRLLTENQLAKRVEINRRILQRTARTQ